MIAPELLDHFRSARELLPNDLIAFRFYSHWFVVKPDATPALISHDEFLRLGTRFLERGGAGDLFVSDQLHEGEFQNYHTQRTLEELLGL